MNNPLRDIQQRVWQAVRSSSLPVYLVGGTALAFKYHHRESEDLDFFCQREDWGRSLPARVARRITAVTGFRAELLGQQTKLSMVGMARYEFETNGALVVKVDVVQDHNPLLRPLEDGMASTDDLYLRKIRAAIGWGSQQTIIGRPMPGGRQQARDVYDLWWLSTRHEPLHKWFPRYFQRADYERLADWLRRTPTGQQTILELLKIEPQPDTRAIRAHMDRQADLLNRRFVP